MTASQPRPSHNKRPRPNKRHPHPRNNNPLTIVTIIHSHQFKVQINPGNNRIARVLPRPVNDPNFELQSDSGPNRVVNFDLSDPAFVPLGPGQGSDQYEK